MDWLYPNFWEHPLFQEALFTSALTILQMWINIYFWFLCTKIFIYGNKNNMYIIDINNFYAFNYQVYQ